MTKRNDDTCPSWCDVDHQAHLPGDDPEETHSCRLAEGAYTVTHGPIYTVDLEDSGSETRIWTTLEASNLNAGQAEVFGLALIRAAAMLRATSNASDEVKLTNYIDGRGKFVRVDREVLEPTAAEQALNTGCAA